jgi:SAM-dependent methyltransferase
MLGELQYRILRTLAPDGSAGPCDGATYANSSKLTVLLGTDFLGRIKDKTVIDFGCGDGAEAVELAERGAGRVIGIDIREGVLAAARERAAAAGVGDRCEFTTSTDVKADIIISLDAFEHFENPADILCIMSELLASNGEVMVSFGPTWYHPLGGHLFSVFPWAHLIFSERALIRWRSDFKTDGATRFREVAGGLNQMTISRFEQLVAQSDFRIPSLESVPIRKLKALHSRWTREFTTSIVRCRLVKQMPADSQGTLL